VVTAVGLAVVVPRVLKAFEGVKVELVDGSVSETLSPPDNTSCIWTVRFSVYSPNRPEGHIWLIDADIDLNSSGTALQSNHVDGRVWAAFPAELAYTLDPCPGTVDEVAHGQLELTYRIKNHRSPKTVNLGL
jgi:hypothetical protein